MSEQPTPNRVNRDLTARLNRFTLTRRQGIVGLAELIGLAGGIFMLVLVIVSYLYFLLPARSRLYNLQSESSLLQSRLRNSEEVVRRGESTDATVQNIHQYGRGLLAAGQKEKALEVFKYNAQKNLATDPFTPNVGLARGYTAMGDKKKAITYWEEAIKNIPEGQKANIKFYQGELDKLKTGK